MSYLSATATPWFPTGSLFTQLITCRCGHRVNSIITPDNCTYCNIIKTNAAAYDHLHTNMTVFHTVDTSKDVNIVHVVPKVVDVVPKVVDAVPKVVDPVLNTRIFETIVKCTAQGCHETISNHQPSLCCSQCDRDQPLNNLLTMHFGKINQSYIFEIVVRISVFTCITSCTTPQCDPEINTFEHKVYLPALQSALDDSQKINCSRVNDKHRVSRAINFYLSFLSYYSIDSPLICHCMDFISKPEVINFFAVPVCDDYNMSRIYDMARPIYDDPVDMDKVSNFLNTADTDTDTD